MHNIKLQAESIQLGMYSNIICQILLSHKSLSVFKTVTFSYLIKQNRFLGGKIYTANNSQDIIYKGISLLSGDFDGFCNSVPYIVKAIHLLISKGIVYYENDILKLNTKDFATDSVYEETNFMKKVIEESKTFTDKQFMKEVISNV
ncbi:hypothetical protein BKP56_05470 [Marinilactibacillus sp. 15R]|uniref:hypothetical protein n=1 Tax=Marinilactibacillus sp. 15R TaxID=1911586 RepID=UPI00090CBF54|nr:hypothetical protein [Marinilactibacillus sp. 15R]API88770.1 hypothetical protein BKP56_05470 [Marinilactibacillus sp. 15R]